jgi:hypothetical protein
MTRLTKWLAGTNALLGLWLIAAPYVLSTSAAGLYNDVVLGIVIATVAAYNLYRASTGGEVSYAMASLNALAGLWMLVVPLLLGVTGAALWNDLVVGALVALFAGYNAYAGNAARRDRDAPATA